MDPLSFTASLVTLTGMVSVTFKSIHNLLRKFRDAPKDVETLLVQLRTLEGLLEELEVQLEEHRNNSSPQDTLQLVWGRSIERMRQDIEGLNIIVSKLVPLANKGSLGSRFLLSARGTLSEKEVAKYQKCLDTYCGTLMNIQTMVRGRRLDQLSQNTIAIGTENKVSIQTVCSQLSQITIQLGDEIRQGLVSVGSKLTHAESANRSRHQAVLSRLNDHVHDTNCNGLKLEELSGQQPRAIDFSEAGFQAISAELVRLGGQVPHVQRGDITFESMRHNVHSLSDRPRESNLMASKATIFWQFYPYILPIGSLQISLHQARHSKRSKRSVSQEYRDSAVTVTFVPPRWLSSSAIKYALKLSCGSTTSNWQWSASSQPLIINCNHVFLEAVKKCDIEGIRRSFQEGIARPTDHILSFGLLCPWYDSYHIHFEASWERWHQYNRMLKFMIKEGLYKEDCIVRYISRNLSGSDKMKRELSLDLIYTYIKHNGQTSAGNRSGLFEFLIVNVDSISWDSSALFESLEVTMADDLSSLNVCLVSTLARADATFRDLLKKSLASYHSPFLSEHASRRDCLYESTFGTTSIVRHFRLLNRREKLNFLHLLCKLGSVSILKSFLDLGVDVNEEKGSGNLLGAAAVYGKLDMIQYLLDIGANGALAFHGFLYGGNRLSDTLYKRILTLLVESATPTSSQGYLEDPFGLISGPHRNRLLSLCPETPEALIKRELFQEKLLIGGGFEKPDVYRSYMFMAIKNEQHHVVSCLLHHGAQADMHITNMFNFIDGFYDWVEPCTWLTVAVELGSASCANILIQHGANIYVQDGAGRSAIQLARSNVLSAHPRYSNKGYKYYTAEDDAKTLAVIERAFNLKFQGSKRFEDYEDTSPEIDEQSPTPLEIAVPSLKMLVMWLRSIIITPYQIRGNWAYSIHRLWRSSFQEALLIRFFYVLSYFLLFGLELLALATGAKQVPRPSRSLLSAVAVLLLALVWGFSWWG